MSHIYHEILDYPVDDHFPKMNNRQLAFFFSKKLGAVGTVLQTFSEDIDPHDQILADPTQNKTPKLANFASWVDVEDQRFGYGIAAINRPFAAFIGCSATHMSFYKYDRDPPHRLPPRIVEDKEYEVRTTFESQDHAHEPLKIFDRKELLLSVAMCSKLLTEMTTSKERLGVDEAFYIAIGGMYENRRLESQL